MTTNFETRGGVVTQGEAFSKLLHHIDEAMDQMATLSHLARAQANTGKDRAIADGWIACVELFKRIRYQIVALAQGKLQ